MLKSEDERKNKESFKPKKVRKELIMFMLQKYGSLKTSEIAKVLGHSRRTIRRTLKKLEESDRVEGEKMGRSYIWSPVEKEEKMYF